MKKLNNLRWFTLGLVVCLLVTTLIVPAFASTLSKTAQLVYDNIKITINGTSVTPKDASGNTVEPFTIDGTTYLPVRAVANALGISVIWDETTKTVKLSNGQAAPSGTVLYENNGVKITYLGIATRKYGGEEVNLFIQNSSAKNYLVQSRNVSVNGIMTSPVFSCSVAAGKSAYNSIEFPDNTLKGSNITSINTVELTFMVADHDHMLDYFESGIIKINK